MKYKLIKQKYKGEQSGNNKVKLYCVQIAHQGPPALETPEVKKRDRGMHEYPVPSNAILPNET